ncbi:MAG TPA: PIN domain-containing protein [Opitutales bacterium]|nr:PIN domain-containing protein [Opitutales bacterium]
MRAVIDTNIIIDVLKGIPESLAILKAISVPAISPITWMEVMAGARDLEEKTALRCYWGILQSSL